MRKSQLEISMLDADSLFVVRVMSTANEIRGRKAVPDLDNERRQSRTVQIKQPGGTDLRNGPTAPESHHELSSPPTPLQPAHITSLSPRPISQKQHPS